MNPVYISLITIFILVFILVSKNKIIAFCAARRANRRKNFKEVSEMKELAERFIGKECIVYTVNSDQITGVLREIASGAILLERTDSTEAINLEFVVRIRDYPRKKDGKKKSIFV